MGDIFKEIKNLFRVKGKTREETLENISFVIIIFSAILVSLGIALGSFFKGVILIASIGSFTLLVGIVIFVIAEVLKE